MNNHYDVSDPLQACSKFHICCSSNAVQVVDYLAAKGQELARTITSDKVQGVRGMTFLDLCTKVFEAIPAMKLGPAETVRFEKTWVHAGAVHLVTLLDPVSHSFVLVFLLTDGMALLAQDVRYMLPRSCEEIMQDVLARFDPRPETGVFITNEVTGERRNDDQYQRSPFGY